VRNTDSLLQISQRGQEFTEIFALIPKLTDLAFKFWYIDPVQDTLKMLSNNMMVAYATEWSRGCPDLCLVEFLDGATVVRDFGARHSDWNVSP
jgi:hypothetical protein